MEKGAGKHSPHCLDPFYKDEGGKSGQIGVGKIRERGPVRKLISEQGKQEEVSANLAMARGLEDTEARCSSVVRGPRPEGGFHLEKEGF